MNGKSILYFYFFDEKTYHRLKYFLLDLFDHFWVFYSIPNFMGNTYIEERGLRHIDEIL